MMSHMILQKDQSGFLNTAAPIMSTAHWRTPHNIIIDIHFDVMSVTVLCSSLQVSSEINIAR